MKKYIFLFVLLSVLASKANAQDLLEILAIETPKSEQDTVLKLSDVLDEVPSRVESKKKDTDVLELLQVLKKDTIRVSQKKNEEEFSAFDLLDVLEKEAPKTKNYATATFKGTRILNGHSIENRKKGVTEFVISHRFGRVNLGFDELYGLDQSNIRFALERGITDNLMLGFGRSSFEKTYDGFVKYKLLKQESGEGAKIPVSVSAFGSVALRTIKDFEPGKELSFNEKLTYVSQLLIARKFNADFSLQFTPTYIHFNSVKTAQDPHDLFALGVGGRVKLSKRVSLNVEYHHNLTPFDSIKAQDSMALGVDIETGGHVFQIILSNSITMIEKGFIAEGTDEFFKGDIHLGFNISRAFQSKKRK